ncbi:MAG TPA: biopolymer transporter Tol [Microlunatus sp.]|nr:biopolymer transporter Tol [Microlunatus sp.]
MTDVDQDPRPGRQLRPGQRTEVWIAEVADGSPARVLSTTDLLLEAPNWSPDGTALLLNGDGLLWRFDLATAVLRRVEIAELPPINNDHVIDPPRNRIFLSADDGHIHEAPLTGGTARRITHDDSRYHFLHGVSPDGSTLAFVELPRDPDAPWIGRLALVPSSGGQTRYPHAGRTHLDGPEYSPDGAWIYLNTEEFGVRPGHAQVARVSAGGGPLEQLVVSDTVDWFPHLSPDGNWATYVVFPTGTLGHPADLDVEVRLVRTSDWTTPVAGYPLFGGQGTLNVNSWSPDSTRFAFVSYPLED